MQLMNTHSQIHIQPGWCGADSVRVSFRIRQLCVSTKNEHGMR
jgi:hypothetical protein